jgi:hypothetical protein
MKIITILVGIILTVLAFQNYQAVGAWLPILFAAGIVILGVVALKHKGKHSNAQFGALMLAMLILIGSLRGVFNLFQMLTGGQVNNPPEAILRSIMAAVCVVFIGLGVVLIKDFWTGWKAFGHFLGNALARVVLTFFYFTVFVPFGLGVRLLSDPLHVKTTPSPLWRPRSTGDKSLEDVKRQY